MAILNIKIKHEQSKISPNFVNKSKLFLHFLKLYKYIQKKNLIGICHLQVPF